MHSRSMTPSLGSENVLMLTGNAIEIDLSYGIISYIIHQPPLYGRYLLDIIIIIIIQYLVAIHAIQMVHRSSHLLIVLVLTNENAISNLPIACL